MGPRRSGRLDLQLTHRGEYTLRAALALARAGSDRHVKLREVSAEMSIPPRYTQAVLTILMRAGLAEARAGKQGGYRLTVDPREISLLQLVEAAEGPLRADRCTLTGVPCQRQDRCAVHDMWAEAAAALTGSLRRRTLWELATTEGKSGGSPSGA